MSRRLQYVCTVVFCLREQYLLTLDLIGDLEHSYQDLRGPLGAVLGRGREPEPERRCVGERPARPVCDCCRVGGCGGCDAEVSSFSIPTLPRGFMGCVVSDATRCNSTAGEPGGRSALERAAEDEHRELLACASELAAAREVEAAAAGAETETADKLRRVEGAPGAGHLGSSSIDRR